MPHTPSTAEPASRPERDGAGVPEGIAHFLTILRWIIGYGRNLAEAVRRRDPAADLGGFTVRYGAISLDDILARIKRGLMLALALEQKLRQRAATGRDIAPVPYRHSKPGRKRPAEANKRTSVRHTAIIDLPLDQLPTAAQIAAELRRRPLGAVLADICRQFGIGPGNMTTAQWLDLQRTVTRYGGSARDMLYTDARRRTQKLLDWAWGRGQPAQPVAAATANEAARPTGPPPAAQAA